VTKYTVEAGSGWRATLDGKQVLYAQEADDVEGYVLALLIDAEGKPIFDRAREEWAIVRREGKVQVQKSTVTPEQRALIAADDNAFRVELARADELSIDYADTARYPGWISLEQLAEALRIKT
jgi:hypothetical protein